MVPQSVLKCSKLGTVICIQLSRKLVSDEMSTKCSLDVVDATPVVKKMCHRFLLYLLASNTSSE
jgi:hypothetical protein